MNKFKCTYRSPDCGRKFTVGKIYEEHNGILIDDNGQTRMLDGLVGILYKFEPVADRHELHITSDGTTTNAVYKLNGKVKKQAKAVCCPSDTFNFNTGAELAINRVLYGTDYNPKDVAIAKLVCVESAPKQDEPIMLYCVKDYEKWLTKGKTYTFDSNGQIVFDNGWDNSIINRGETLEAFRKRNPNMSACLIRAEKRAAKVGEWVVIVDSYSPTGYKNGDVLQVKRMIGEIGIEVAKTNCCYLYNREYLVLPDYVPEKVEPVYWSGKVVCVESGGILALTVGKAYSIKDGFFINDWGNKNPVSGIALKSLKDMNSRNLAKFIEYRGEQS